MRVTLWISFGVSSSFTVYIQPIEKQVLIKRNFTYFTQQSLADSSWHRHCVSFSSLNVLSICIASPALCFLPQNPGSVSNGECQDILTLSLWVLCLWRRFWGGNPIHHYTCDSPSWCSPQVPWTCLSTRREINRAAQHVLEHMAFMW